MAALVIVERNWLSRASSVVASLVPAAILISIVITRNALAKRLVITGTG